MSEPITQRRLTELGIPDTSLDLLKKQATEGVHFIRNGEAHGRIEWQAAGVDWLLAHGDLAGLKPQLEAALKKSAPTPTPVSGPSTVALVAVRRAINETIVLCRQKDAEPTAPLVRVRCHPSTPAPTGYLITGRPVPGFSDLFEIVGHPTRPRI